VLIICALIAAPLVATDIGAMVGGAAVQSMTRILVGLILATAVNKNGEGHEDQ
jgi:hypothetical protein